MTVQKSSTADIDPLRQQHLHLHEEQIVTPDGRRRVLINDAESPLLWLARRKGRDGKALIAPHQLLAGERLRLDFTRAHLMPRTTTNWQNAIPLGRGTGNPAAHITDVMVAARQRVQHALAAVGPEFSGLLVDVCCFLKKLDDLERARSWPARSAKIVLQLGLDRLARHYGLDAQASGRARAAVRTWLADDAEFTAEIGSEG
jgi:hypothetical protein